MFRNEFILNLLIIVYYIYYTDAVMEGNIIGGQFDDIKNFPHAAAIFISCVVGNLRQNSLCGGSILNQNILLSAAHCFEGCARPMTPESDKTIIHITVGSTSNIEVNSLATNYTVHESYNFGKLINDLALIYVRTPFILGDKVKRVILPDKPTKAKRGYVSGWGSTNSFTGVVSNELKSLKQKILTWDECQKLLNTPKGTICGTVPDKDDRADQGDSGSGLMVKTVIQVGLVSYKDPLSEETITVYTDVYYYREWIWKHIKELMCA